jgi:outer membrane protein TolC
VTGAASQSDRTFNINSFGIPFPSSGPDALGPRIGPVQTFDARVRATQTIADVSDWRRVRSARAGAEASRADARTSAQEAAEIAALRYVDATRAAATLAARDADLAIASQLDSLARVQLRSGTAANIDVLRARAQSVAARAERALAWDALQRARIDLARALGADPAAGLELADSLGAPVTSDAPDERAAALRMGLERRSEIGAETARLAEARAERGAIAAERIPRLDAAADYGASGLHWDDAIATRQVALQISWPFFDGTRREARLSEQTSIVHEAEVRARDLTQQVAAEIGTALLEVGSGREQETIASERVDLALQELSEARVRFRNGVASNIEIIDAQSALVRARDAAIAAHAATAIAHIHLARAAGVAETMR